MQQKYPSTTSIKSGSSDWRLPLWTIVNIFLIWPWYLLRVAFDSGEHHPDLVFGLSVLTLWTWWQLISALLERFRDMGPSHRRDDERRR